VLVEGVGEIRCGDAAELVEDVLSRHLSSAPATDIGPSGVKLLFPSSSREPALGGIHIVADFSLWHGLGNVGFPKGLNSLLAATAVVLGEQFQRAQLVAERDLVNAVRIAVAPPDLVGDEGLWGSSANSCALLPLRGPRPTLPATRACPPARAP
jgi:hypothetical protein